MDVKEKTSEELKRSIIDKACKTVKEEFTATMESQKLRPDSEQIIIGDCLTQLEIQILKKLKQ